VTNTGHCEEVVTGDSHVAMLLRCFDLWRGTKSSGRGQVEQPAEIESDLVDVNDLSLDQLATLPDTALRRALRRALVVPDADAEQFAMHQVSL